MDGLYRRGLDNCVNIIITSDHGEFDNYDTTSIQNVDKSNVTRMLQYTDVFTS